MNWKRFAIAPRRQLVSTTLIYGLSLTLHFISPIGDGKAAQAARGPAPLPSMLRERASPTWPAMPVALYEQSSPRSSRAACNEPALLASLPDCAAP
jgi:hypothetical protein